MPAPRAATHRVAARRSASPRHASHRSAAQRLATVFVFLLMIGPASAADKCYSRSEARTIWPKAYLHWRSIEGRRCWINRRAVHRARAPAAALPKQVERPATPPLYIPAELIPHRLEPPAPAPPDRRFTWLEDARAEATIDRPEPIEPFSTFAPGQEPDVWPPCCDPQPVGAILPQLAIALATVLVAGAAGWFLYTSMKPPNSVIA